MRTIDDIVPPSRRRETESFTNEPSNQPVQRRPRHSDSRFPTATLAVVILIIAAAFGALYYFSSARVEITPDTVSAAIQSSFTATPNTGDLPYQVITVQQVATQTVKSTGTKEENTPASGTITIYNTQSNAQTLIANTRFATTAGLIFRIHKAVKIPGGTASNPGITTVTVYADKPGDSYNVGATSFTIPGFAGTPQENQVYARSSGTMSGGTSGTIPVIDSGVDSQARQALSNALAPSLMASLQSKVPEGYILLDGSATTTFQELSPATASTTDMANVREQGTATGIIFPNAALAKAIAGSITGLDYNSEPVTLLPTSSLKLSASTLPDPNAASFPFVLTGTVSLVYTIDPTRIAAAIAGKTHASAEIALTNYTEVKSATLVLRPFWRTSFPQDPSSITVVVSNPQ